MTLSTTIEERVGAFLIKNSAGPPRLRIFGLEGVLGIHIISLTADPEASLAAREPSGTLGIGPLASCAC